MPQYVIEREMPGVGLLGVGDLKQASQTSCSVCVVGSPGGAALQPLPCLT